MTTLNLLWPTWARVVSRVPYRTVQARGVRCWKLVQLAAQLFFAALESERHARLALSRWRSETRCIRRTRREARRWIVSAALLLGALAASPGSAEDEDKGSALFRSLGLAMYGTKAGDLVSTELLIANGGHELNPFMQSRGVRIAATAAAPIVVNWASEELRQDGHPKLALWMRISAVALFGYATAHNLRAAR